MGGCKVDNLVFEKIIDSINELGFAKWIVLIVMALSPVIIDIYYKSVNSKYYRLFVNNGGGLNKNKPLFLLKIHIISKT